MLGAIAGDIIGSRYEANPIKTKDFPLFSANCRFTDDSVLTIAVAEAIINQGDYQKSIRNIGRKYPDAGYGGSFIRWLFSNNPEPYNSWGNGAAMRVSPVGLAFDTVDKVLQEAAKTAEISHNHPEGIKGAQATALAVFLARAGHSKKAIKNKISARFEYNLERSLDSIRPNYSFDVSCQGTVPEAIIAFLESDCWVDAIRNAISLGGDSDTLANITGGIAEAFYGIPNRKIRNKVKKFLTYELWEICTEFYNKLNIKI